MEASSKAALLLTTLRKALSHPSIPCLAAILGVVLMLPALGMGWLADDEVHRIMLLGPPPGIPAERATIFNLFSFTGYDPGANRRLVDAGALPWWTHPDLHLAFFRPVTVLTHMLDYRLWPNSAPMMHAQSLIWFGGALLAAGLLYRNLLNATWPLWTAGLAAALFAVDGAHAIPASWIANRNSLTTAFFGFAAILAHDRRRRGGWRPGAFAGPLLLALALLSGEAAVAAGGYLLAYALFVDPADGKRRLAALIPYVAVAAVWMLFYKRLGYGAWGSELYIDPVTDPGRFAKALAMRAPVLLAGQLGVPPPDVSVILLPSGQRVFIGLALAFIALVGVALAPVLRRDPVARFFALGMLLSLVPISATFPSQRLLFFTGFGALGLVAQLLAALADGAPWLPRARSWKLIASALALFFILLHGVASPLLTPMGVLTLPAILGGAISVVTEGIPKDPSVAEKEIFIVNLPTPMLTSYAALQRCARGEPYPRYIRVLASSNYRIDLRRTGDKTLIVRPENGLTPPIDPRPSMAAKHHVPGVDLANAIEQFGMIARDRAHPLVLGERVDLTGVSMEITALTPDGRAAEFLCRFDAPLEDPRHLWLQWMDGSLAPFTPPAVGESARLPAVGLPF